MLGCDSDKPEIMTVYCSGLLAGLGFFWSSKAKENSSTASLKISLIESQVELLSKLQTDIDYRFQDRIEQLNIKKNVEGIVVTEANNFPGTEGRRGFVSIVVAIGTLFQLFSFS